MHKHGGTAIFVHSSLVNSCTDLVSVASGGMEKIFEFSAVKLNLQNHSVYILCAYRAPNSDLNVFLDRLEISVSKIMNKSSIVDKMIFCGDLNINSLKENNESLLLMDLMNSLNLFSVFSVPTRYTSTTATCIDYIFVNFQNEVKISEIISNGLSDHTAQLIAFDCASPSKIKKQFRSLSARNIVKFCTGLKEENWHSVTTSSCPNDALRKFMSTLQSHYEQSFRLKSYAIDIAQNNSWITPGLKISSQKLKLLHNMMRDNKIDSEYYRKYKRTYQKVIRLAKQLYN